MNIDNGYKDFTEDEYRKLVRKAKNAYRFISYTEYLNNKNDNRKRVIWRHDIDFSVHRAVRLAEIENEEGVTSVFFVLFSSTFYNVFEKGIKDRLKKIVSLGHKLGIHLDMDQYEELPDKERLIKDLNLFANLLKIQTDTMPTSFSFHNPTQEILNKFEDEYIGGYINAYSKTIMKGGAYCSDSNGYWRFQSINEVLNRKDITMACVLTHPIWWTPEELSPRSRIQRAIDGRSYYMGESYDGLLRDNHRENIL